MLLIRRPPAAFRVSIHFTVVLSKNIFVVLLLDFMHLQPFMLHVNLSHSNLMSICVIHPRFHPSAHAFNHPTVLFSVDRSIEPPESISESTHGRIKQTKTNTYTYIHTYTYTYIHIYIYIYIYIYCVRACVGGEGGGCVCACVCVRVCEPCVCGFFRVSSHIGKEVCRLFADILITVVKIRVGVFQGLFSLWVDVCRMLAGIVDMFIKVDRSI